MLIQTLNPGDLLLCHPLQSLERGLHVGLGQADQQAVVLHSDLVDGLAAALLQTPLQLRGQMLEAVLSGINQLQLRQQRRWSNRNKMEEQVKQPVDNSFNTEYTERASKPLTWFIRQ